jgi:hypothetical protein
MDEHRVELGWCSSTSVIRPSSHGARGGDSDWAVGSESDEPPDLGVQEAATEGALEQGEPCPATESTIFSPSSLPDVARKVTSMPPGPSSSPQSTSSSSLATSTKTVRQNTDTAGGSLDGGWRMPGSRQSPMVGGICAHTTSCYRGRKLNE